ncbi:MAG: long-chain-fatty-acid--CoA ligase [Betaproteobacteria bacterium]
MEKIWLKGYPAGVPAEINPDSMRSVVAVFEDACRRYGEKTAFISMGVELTYAELDGASRKFAGWLQAQGFEPGTRVALMMPNLLQYPIALFGALRAGCVVVSCNPLYTPRELEYQLQDSGAEAIVVLENFAHTVERVLQATRVRRVVVTTMGETLGTFKGALVNFFVRHVKKLVPHWSLPGAISFSQALVEGERHGMTAVTVRGEDIAFLQYTGGTTGVTKGAVLTHRNICANVAQAEVWIKSALREGEELVVTALPLYHVFALTANCLTFLLIGARNLLIVNPRDTAGFVKELGRYPFTVITGVNTLFNALLNHPGFAKLDFSHLRLTLGGGMAVQDAVARQWQAVTGDAMLQAYGLTESSPGVTLAPLEMKEFNGSIGLPLPSTEISIRDDAGQELGIGEVGEICVRGPQVMRGYWQRPEETAIVMTEDGFLHTGDIGYVDQDGFVFFVDRKKDTIVVSGFNVYPNEIEDMLVLHPGIREAAAIGIPDEKSGEVVKVFIVRRDPDLTAEEVIHYCREHLTGYKVPRQVEFRNGLPHTNVGKILRRELRAEQKAA